MVDIIIDANGNERRCGSLPMPKNRVSSLPPFGSAPNQPLWSDEQIKEVVTDPSRMPSRELFGPEWILDQLSFGSCNGHALAAAGARARWLRGIRDKLLFSGAYSYSKMNGGRDNGSIIEDDIEVGTRYGFCPLSLVPANQIYPSQQPKTADAEAAKNKGLEAYKVVGDWSTKMRAVRTALAQRFGVIVAVMAGNGYSRVDSRGVCVGVDAGSGDHAVLGDDLLWDGKRWLYDSPGSWGTTLGHDGRVYLTDNHFKQTLGPHEFVVIPSIDSHS